ncbi:MAG: penicillin acylase family protein [Desulfobacterales bacterium]|nr:MAG: penicillin acylase family protein [Desulfobacterales bacterium]
MTALIILDDYGVPHIFLGNDNDLFFVQGYITAGEGMFQISKNL